MVQVRLGRKFDPTLHGKAQQIRIAAEGITAIKPIWERYVEFCDDLLAGCSKEELAAHQKVNEHISEILRQRRDPANQVLGRSA